MKIGDVLIKKFRAPVFNTRLWVVVSSSVQKSIDVVEDLIDHRIVTDENEKRAIKALTYSFQNHDGKAVIIMFIKNNARPGLIAHEANHAVSWILNWHGVKPSFANDETESYYLERIVDKVHNVLKEYNK